MLVAEGGHSSTVAKLLRMGADPHAKDEKEKTALMLAAEKSHSSTVAKLVNLQTNLLFLANHRKSQFANNKRFVVCFETVFEDAGTLKAFTTSTRTPTRFLFSTVIR